MNLRKHLIMKCKICGKEFYRTPSKIRARTCSVKCGRISQRQKLKGRRLSKKLKIKYSKIAKQKGFGKWMKGRKNPKLAAIARLQTGEKNPRWKDGITSKLQQRCSSQKWIQIRSKIYKRDNWTCQKCGKKCHTDIQCHHSIPESEGGSHIPENLVTLCKSCHIKVENEYNGHRRWDKKPIRWTNIPVTANYVR